MYLEDYFNVTTPFMNAFSSERDTAPLCIMNDSKPVSCSLIGPGSSRGEKERSKIFSALDISR